LERFESEYEALFGKGAAFREAGFEVTAVRAIGTGSLGTMKAPDGGEPLRHLGSREVVFEYPRKPLSADVYAVDYPKAGQTVEGPCVVEFPGQTVVVPPGSLARSDELGNLHVRSKR
jgi:N-methylhydantoinase A